MSNSIGKEFYEIFNGKSVNKKNYELLKRVDPDLIIHDKNGELCLEHVFVDSVRDCLAISREGDYVRISEDYALNGETGHDIDISIRIDHESETARVFMVANEMFAATLPSEVDVNAEERCNIYLTSYLLRLLFRIAQTEGEYFTKSYSVNSDLTSV